MIFTINYNNADDMGSRSPSTISDNQIEITDEDFTKAPIGKVLFIFYHNSRNNLRTIFVKESITKVKATSYR
jgi:hypothetical protein